MTQERRPLYTSYTKEIEGTIWDLEKVGRVCEKIVLLAYEKFSPQTDKKTAQDQAEYFYQVVSGKRKALAQAELAAYFGLRTENDEKDPEKEFQLIREMEGVGFLLIPIPNREWSLGISTGLYLVYVEDEAGELTDLSSNPSNTPFIIISASEGIIIRRKTITYNAKTNQFRTRKNIAEEEHKPLLLEEGDKLKIAKFVKNILDRTDGLALYTQVDLSNLEINERDLPTTYTLTFSGEMFSQGRGKIKVVINKESNPANNNILKSTIPYMREPNANEN